MIFSKYLIYFLILFFQKSKKKKMVEQIFKFLIQILEIIILNLTIFFL